MDTRVVRKSMFFATERSEAGAQLPQGQQDFVTPDFAMSAKPKVPLDHGDEASRTTVSERAGGEHHILEGCVNVRLLILPAVTP
ncbi:hypothetical protein [Halostagnicola sp. A-GB9-2]|uniref:hypothetical protein n=1 Tax=Halostagnicola sp. A-GB9-2 TaxID=3048066 RepID=UPI0024BFEF10|nr:hypothetical protein [Halostagnicola sp. A-GB9-2]MDJ1434311.1 hypothetical protein [Halostagnicola sp. A-GB9-2]